MKSKIESVFLDFVNWIERSGKEPARLIKTGDVRDMGIFDYLLFICDGSSDFEDYKQDPTYYKNRKSFRVKK